MAAALLRYCPQRGQGTLQSLAHYSFPKAKNEGVGRHERATVALRDISLR